MLESYLIIIFNLWVDNIMYLLGWAMMLRSVVKHCFGFFCQVFQLRLVFKSVWAKGLLGRISHIWGAAPMPGQDQSVGEAVGGPICWRSQNFVVIVACLPYLPGCHRLLGCSLLLFLLLLSGCSLLCCRLLLDWALGVLSPPGDVPVTIDSLFMLLHRRRHRHQDVQPSGGQGSHSHQELVHSLRTAADYSGDKVSFHKCRLQKDLLELLLHPMQDICTVGLVPPTLTNKWVQLLPGEFSPCGLLILCLTRDVYFPVCMYGNHSV